MLHHAQSRKSSEHQQDCCHSHQGPASTSSGFRTGRLHCTCPLHDTDPLRRAGKSLLHPCNRRLPLHARSQPSYRFPSGHSTLRFHSSGRLLLCSSHSPYPHIPQELRSHSQLHQLRANQITLLAPLHLCAYLAPCLSASSILRPIHSPPIWTLSLRLEPRSWMGVADNRSSSHERRCRVRCLDTDFPRVHGLLLLWNRSGCYGHLQKLAIEVRLWAYLPTSPARQSSTYWSCAYYLQLPQLIR